jgi:hypothetical protein
MDQLLPVVRDVARHAVLGLGFEIWGTAEERAMGAALRSDPTSPEELLKRHSLQWFAERLAARGEPNADPDVQRRYWDRVAREQTRFVPVVDRLPSALREAGHHAGDAPFGDVWAAAVKEAKKQGPAPRWVMFVEPDHPVTPDPLVERDPQGSDTRRAPRERAQTQRVDRLRALGYQGRRLGTYLKIAAYEETHEGARNRQIAHAVGVSAATLKRYRRDYRLHGGW